MRTKLFFLSLALMVMGGANAVKADGTYVEPGTYTFTGINASGVSWGVAHDTMFDIDNDEKPFFTATLDGNNVKFRSAKSFTDSGNNSINWSDVLAASSDGSVYISSTSGKSGLGVNRKKTGYLLIKNLKADDVLAVKIGYWYGNYYLAGYGQDGVAGIEGVTSDNADLGVDSKNGNTATKTITSDGHVIIKIVATSDNINAIGSITITRAGVETVSAPSAIISSYDDCTITVTPGESDDTNATVATYYSTTTTVYTDENKNTAWEEVGNTNTLRFTYPGDHGKIFSFVTVSSTGKTSAVYTMDALALYTSITVSDDLLATYSFNGFHLDFSNVTGLKAYRAHSANSSSGVVSLTKVGKLKGSQWSSAVLLKAEADGTYQVPFVDATSEGIENYGNYKNGSNDNYFISTQWSNSDAGYSGSAVSTCGTTTGYTNFILGKNSSGVIGFYKANGNSITRGKAFLHISNNLLPESITGNGDAEARVSFVFDDETTAVDGVRVIDNNNTVYNLRGQRVSQPVKGIYIVNGKKVILK